MNILIKNVHVITGNMNNMYTGIMNIAIKKDTIYYIGNEIPPGFKAERIIEGREMIAMPGLVNAHTHSTMVLMRNASDDLPLERWLNESILPKEKKLTKDIIRKGSMLGMAEMIKSGTTTFLDMYLEMETITEAVIETGMRANISYGLQTCDRLFQGTEFAAKYCSDFKRKYDNANNGKIKTSIEVHSVYLCDEELLRANAKLSREINSPVHIHLHETRIEVETSKLKYGRSPIKECLKAGIFDVPAIAAHTIWLDDEDMQILKDHHVTPVHNPSSNLKLASGIARVPDMIKMGIDVAIGTDGAASNNNMDMFEEMHLTSLIHKGVKLDATSVNASQTIHMATINGAKALGFQKIGMLEVGMKADIILVNTTGLNNTPLNNPVSAIVYSTRGNDVDTVICNGDILMEGRELKTIDEEKVKFEANAAAKQLLES
ncbi:MAG: amidohydrolase [Clostridia bacterium]|nr:amidohydrolase [Clostridia bacterium]